MKRFLNWLASLLAPAPTPAPTPQKPDARALVFEAEQDDQLVEIDEDGRIWVHGEPRPTEFGEPKKSNILRDPEGEYAASHGSGE